MIRRLGNSEPGIFSSNSYIFLKMTKSLRRGPAPKAPAVTWPPGQYIQALAHTPHNVSPRPPLPPIQCLPQHPSAHTRRRAKNDKVLGATKCWGVAVPPAGAVGSGLGSGSEPSRCLYILYVQTGSKLNPAEPTNFNGETLGAKKPLRR